MEDQNPISVKDLNDKIKNIIGKELKDTIRVQGEISNLKISGANTWFTLKDTESSISSVFWRKKLDQNDGDLVIIEGKITFYPKSGTYQISVSKIENTGVGNLHKNYDKLKKEFDDKGYFNKKRALPENINRIGILTATGGDALNDVLYRLKENKYVGEIIIKNCNVQGQNCSTSVTAGINYFVQLNKPEKPIDVLVVTRGGGSFEDLMGYSSPDIMRALYDCPIITISAVGHNNDYMLSDFVADFRASTPTDAGNLISMPQVTRRETLLKITNGMKQMKSILVARVDVYENKFKDLQQQVIDIDPMKMIDTKINKFSTLKTELTKSITNKIDKCLYELEKLGYKSSEYDYENILKKGYTIVTTQENDLVYTKERFEDLMKNNIKLNIIFVDGELCINDVITRTQEDGEKRKKK